MRVEIEIPGRVATFSCNDMGFLKTMQGKCDGWKVYNECKIKFPVKALPKAFKTLDRKVSAFSEAALKEMIAVSDNIKKRKGAIDLARREYALDEIPMDGYVVRGIYKPLKHQCVMFNCMINSDVAGILADPGTCKTAAYIWAMDHRIQKGDIKKCLVITLSHLKENVLKEMKAQAPHLRGVVLNNKLQSDMVLNHKYKAAKKNVDYDVYLSNYESMFTLVDLIQDGYFQAVILDEAHRIGSPRSRQTKVIVDKFEYVPYKYIVTGTLNSNNLTSFFMPFRFMGPDTVPNANFYDFRATNFYPVDPDGYVWQPAPQAFQIVQETIGKISVAFRKEDCLDLPGRIYETVKCEMSKEQKEAYDVAEEELYIHIKDICSKCNKKADGCMDRCDDEVIIKNALVKASKLAQITCGFFHNTDKNTIITFEKNPKLDLLLSTLNNIPDDRKVIIWTNFSNAVELICDRVEKAFGKDSYIRVYKQDDAFKAVEEFERNKKLMYMIANPGKAGTGLNIQFSNYQIFFSNNYSYVQRDQAISRQDRQGQTEKVTIFDTVCQKTIDERILKILFNKEELAVNLSMLARMAGIKDRLDGRRETSSNEDPTGSEVDAGDGGDQDNEGGR